MIILQKQSRARTTAPLEAVIMQHRIETLLASALLTLSLAGCEMDPTFMATTPVAQPTAMVDPNVPVDGDVAHYAAVEDEGKTVPAIPVAEIPASFQRQVVDYPTDQPVGTVIIDPSTKHLYLVEGGNKALRYGIAVGRAGFGWSGEADIAGRTTWPKWIPPYEMIDRRPELEKFRDVGQPGGLTNPLGARALPENQWRGLRLPHPRHARMGIDRPKCLIRLHPHAEPGRDGPVHPRPRWHPCHRADRRWPIPDRIACAVAHTQKGQTWCRSRA